MIVSATVLLSLVVSTSMMASTTATVAVPIVAAAISSILAISAIVIVKLAVPAAASLTAIVTRPIIIVHAVALVITEGLTPVVLVSLMMATHATSVTTSMSTSITWATTVAASFAHLLAIWRDYGWLVASHLVVMVHVATIIVVEATTATLERIPSAAAATVVTTTIISWSARSALVLGLCLLDIGTATIDLGHRVILDQILCNALIGKGHESEASR